MKTRQHGPSLFWRACLALGLMVFFYVFAILLAVVLFSIPAFIYQATERVNIQLLIACWFAAGCIVFSIIPRRTRFVAPGSLLSEAEYPALFDVIGQVARATGQAMPKEIYLLHDMNAFVSQRGGVMGFFSRRIMGIGLPLLEILTVPEFKAVLAHEFGHYRRGDTSLGPWIYLTRASIIRTVENMSNDLIRILFVWIGKLFLRITHAVSRQEEFAADAVAVQAVGGGAVAGGFRKLEKHGGAFSCYVQNEWLPMLSDRIVMPLIPGYRAMLAAPEMPAFLERMAQECREADAKADPYSTHPTMRQRLDAVAELAGRDALADEGDAADRMQAITLIPDLAAAENRLFNDVLIAPKDLGTRRCVEWEDVLEAVYFPLWHENLKRYKEELRRIRVGEVGDILAESDRLAALFSRPPAMNDDAAWQTELRNIIGSSLSLVLAARGYKGSALPGHGVRFVCGALTVCPFGRNAGEEAKAGLPAAWADFFNETGLGDVLLSEGFDAYPAKENAGKDECA